MTDTQNMNQISASEVTATVAQSLSGTSEVAGTTLVQQTPQPLTKFHLLEKLPAELRNNVYDHMMPGPRIICITRCAKRGICSDNEIPIILHVSPESRAYARERLTRITFGADYWNKGTQAPFGLYVDYERDVIYPTFRYRSTYLEVVALMEDFVFEEMCRHIRHFAIGPQPTFAQPTSNFYDSSDIFASYIAKMPKIRSVSFVKAGPMRGDDVTPESRMFFQCLDTNRPEIPQLVEDLQYHRVSENILQGLQVYVVRMDSLVCFEKKKDAIESQILPKEGEKKELVIRWARLDFNPET